MRITFSSACAMLFSLTYLSSSKGMPVTRLTPLGMRSTVCLNCATISAAKGE